MIAFITGISRGIGLGLTKRALEHGFEVYGVARAPEELKDLMELQHQFANKLHILKLDLRDDDAPAKIRQALSQVGDIDLLINNAGILEKGDEKKDFMKSFEVNSVLPYLVTHSLLEKLRHSSQPRAIHVSSMMGSITDNSSGGYYAYRSSKSALNMINKSLSVDLPWLTTVVVHPGWVQTRMGGEEAPTSVSDSTNGLWKVIEEIRPSDSGKFFDYQGRQLAW